ncbi:MAG: hypothetical protein JKY95_09095 [Planctomycetaceae bacterium]|nr:hypothetical protein [Planctomycetaceae bacterium]
MKSLKRSLPALALIAMTPCFMAALSVEITSPAAGSGATWDCSDIKGKTAGERDGGGSTVSDSLWKKVGSVWKNDRPLGPLDVAATMVPVGSTDGTWSTKG